MSDIDDLKRIIALDRAYTIANNGCCEKCGMPAVYNIGNFYRPVCASCAPPDADKNALLRRGETEAVIRLVRIAKGEA